MTAEETHMFDNLENIKEIREEASIMNLKEKPKKTLSFPIFTIIISFVQIVILVRIKTNSKFLQNRLGYLLMEELQI